MKVFPISNGPAQGTKLKTKQKIAQGEPYPIVCLVAVEGKPQLQHLCYRKVDRHMEYDECATTKLVQRLRVHVHWN